MARASPGLTSFAGGELSPLLEGRYDLAKYPIGTRRMRNFFPLVQGPARKRGGSYYVDTVADASAKLPFFSFIKSETDAVVLAFGDHSVRFFTNRASINVVGAAAYAGGTTYALNAFVTFGGVQYRSLQAANTGNDPDVSPTWWVEQDAYQIYSPYAAADLFDTDGLFRLSITQSGDVLFIAAGPNYRQQTLSRTTNTSWAFADYAPTDGPFLPQNIIKADSVVVSAATGTVNLTNHAADDPVANGTAGRLIRIEETDKSAVSPWETDKRIAAVGENPVGEKRRSDGHFYTCATSRVVGAGEIEIRTGSVKPIHTEGTFGDGDGKALYSGATLFAIQVGVLWTYNHSGYGIGNITTVAGGGATATVVVDADFPFPASIVSPGSYRWALGAWYAGNFSSAVAFWRDRLIWGSEQIVQASVAGDYYSHAGDEFGEVLSDSAFNITISIGASDDVLWLAPQPGALLIGTGGGELILGEITRNQVLGPANVKFELKTQFGSRRIAPIAAGTATIVVQKGGTVLREIAQFDPDQQELVSQDLTAFAQHMGVTGFVATAYAQNPNPMIFCLRADGKVACLTYDRAEEVIAWSLFDFGGFVEAIAVIPSPAPGVDDLYLSIRRSINCDTVRYVEVMLPPHIAPADPWNACYMDCALTYNGLQNATLQPGDDAVTQGATNVDFTAGGSVFQSGDVGREIVRRYFDNVTDTWKTARARITTYNSGTEVHATILAAFPVSSVPVWDDDDPPNCAIPTTPLEIAANGWALTAITITGLDHLEGETVRVIAGGAAHPSRVVVDGAITLTRQAVPVHVGEPMALPYVQTMNLEAGGDDGTAQGKIKKFSEVTFRLFETMGGQFGPNLSLLRNMDFRRPNDLTDEALPLFTGDKSQDWPEGYETAGRMCYVSDNGFPATLCAIYPIVTVNGQKQGGDYRP